MHSTKIQSMASKTFFPTVGKIKYEGSSSKNPLAFRYYDANKVINGKTMEEHFRFAVCYWHTFCGTGMDPFGAPTLIRPWNHIDSATPSNLKKLSENRADAAFELFQKLGTKYYTFHDVDVCPTPTDNLAEFNQAFDETAKYLKKKQNETGVKLLWGTANLFSHPRYMNGAATSPNASVYARAGAQIKKAMEVTHELGGAGYVFWGGREGYHSLLNTKPSLELDNLAKMLWMAVEHKKNLGATYQLLIEPKAREPSTHQYDYDAQTVRGFLLEYGLENHFKVNIEPNHTTLAGHSFYHDIVMAAEGGYLGSIDLNSGIENVGWDVDMFASDLKPAVIVMYTLLKSGGISPGGFNFDAKVRRESTDLEDIFYGHIHSMDTYARALEIADELIRDGTFDQWRDERYASFDAGIGKKIRDGKASLAELEAFALSGDKNEAQSGRQELFDLQLNRFIF